MADLGQPPPPRWRVVERDRKLVVIDTATGATPAAGQTLPTAPKGSWGLRQLQFDGSAELTTRPFYDDKGPRTIRLDPGSAALIGRAGLIAVGVAFALIVLAITNPWLLLPIVIFWNGTVRTAARRAITAWLDRIEREAS